MSLEIYLSLIKIFNRVLIQLQTWKVRVLHINGYMFLHIQMPSGELWEVELACPQGREFPHSLEGHRELTGPGRSDLQRKEVRLNEMKVVPCV